MSLFPSFLRFPIRGTLTMIGVSVVGAEGALDQPGLLALGALELDCPVPDVGAHLAAGAGGAGVHPAGDHQLYCDTVTT